MTSHSETGLPVGVAVTLAVLLIFINAVFVSAEFALVRVRPGQLDALVRQGKRGARLARYLLERLDETLSICQVGITLTSLGLGWLGEPAFAGFFRWVFSPAEPWIGTASLSLSLAASFLFITSLHIVIGEQVPKYAAIASPDSAARLTALPVRMIGIASWPLVFLLNRAARWTLRPFGLANVGESEAHGAEEIRQLLSHSVRQGRIRVLDAELIDNLLRFSRRKVKQIMVPRSRTVVLRRGASRAELLSILERRNNSRYPVVEDSLDQVLGVVHVKDLLPLLSTTSEAPDLAQLARPMLLVPETLGVPQMLRRFQQRRSHMALVVDEYGGISGIVTLEDVIEELVGEVRDEFDSEERDPVRPRPGGGYLLDPLLPVDAAAELVEDEPERPDGVTTVVGLLQEGLGRLPSAGDRVPFGERHFLVAAEVHGARVGLVELVPDPDAPEEPATEKKSAR